jgi:hypothetical protein
MAKTRADLEDELKERDRRIADLKRELGEARDLIQRQDEHQRDVDEILESWKQAFGMVLDDDGAWTWQPYITDAQQWHDRYVALLRDWNKYVGQFNAAVLKRNVGRPINATAEQIKRVRQLDRKGMSLRAIAEDVEIGLQTVRTILDGDVHMTRADKKQLTRIAPDALQEKLWQRQRQGRRSLPQRLGAIEKASAELHKEVKGLK